MKVFPPNNAHISGKRGNAAVIIGIVFIFGLLGLMIAYNSGATAEESQAAAVARRMESVRRRLVMCHNDVSSSEKGQAVSFENRRSLLERQLDALQVENKMYSEQNTVIESKSQECHEQVKTERKKRTGSAELNASDEVLRLRYHIKNIEAAIESANATRANERNDILRLIEAYSRENQALSARVRQQVKSEAQAQLNLTLQTGVEGG